MKQPKLLLAKITIKFLQWYIKREKNKKIKLGLKKDLMMLKEIVKPEGMRDEALIYMDSFSELKKK